MAAITVHAGDFLKGGGTYMLGSLTLRTRDHPIVGESISISNLAMVEVASEENIKKLGSTIAWGLAGVALFGPVGLLAGLLGKRNRKSVTFVAQFKDGRKLLATTDGDTFIKLQAAAFDAECEREKYAAYTDEMKRMENWRPYGA